MSVAMEDSATKDKSSVSEKSNSSRLLRYPLRSASRGMEEKPPLADSVNSQSSSKRGRVGSSVAKSVSVFDLSGKEKSAKPPRRLSVPHNANASPAQKSFGNITPISEARSKRSSSSQGKSSTPVSDVSKSSIRKKFSTLSSASYWLSQIKLSESAAKHSISLGFFKLALEAGCEPIQKMRDELKSYVRRHNLSEFGETIKELFESYKMPDNYEPSEASRACSEATPEPNQASDDDVGSTTSSITDAEKLKPKALGIVSDETNQVQKSKNESNVKDDSVKKTKKLMSKNVANSKPNNDNEVRGRSMQRRFQKPNKQESAQGNNDKVKKLGKKSVQGEVAGPLNSPLKEEAVQDNKENLVEEITTED